MKLDMGKAWSDAVELTMNNLGLLATILGLFYFLPAFAFAILFPEIANAEPPQPPPGADPEVVMENMREFFINVYAQSWPFLLISTLLQYVGAIAVLALLRPEGNPTVGEALKIGFLGTPTYLATGILTGIAAALVVGIPLGLGFAISPILGVLLIIPALIALVYISVKLVLVPAVIGMEGKLNPIEVIKDSWKATKGNSLRIFAFLIVLAIVAGLILLIATTVLTTVFVLMGDTMAMIGGGFVSSLMGAVFGGLFLVVIGAIYRQLTSGAAPKQVETFE